VATERHPVHVALLGLMGAGKTTIGRPLAAALHRPFLDNDELLRAATGTTAAALAARSGIGALHDEERAIALAAVARPEPAVIAIAASLGDDPAALDDLRRHAFVVWLHADPAVLAARVPGEPHRPQIDALVQRGAAREVAFAAVADLEVDTGPGDPNAAVATIVGVLAAR
jgi:shikimate kinase